MSSPGVLLFACGGVRTGDESSDAKIYYGKLHGSELTDFRVNIRRYENTDIDIIVGVSGIED